MNTLLIFSWIVLAFIVMAFLEKTIEGPNSWGRKTYGWRYIVSKKLRLTLTEYHLFFWIFLILLFSLPLIINYSNKLLGILISAFCIGFIIEDFLYFIVNPYFGIKKFNKKQANWYPWIGLGKFQIPVSYLIGIIITILSWYFLWR